MDWIAPHLGLTMTDRELALRERDVRTETLTNLKTTIHAILAGVTGIQRKSRVFGLGAPGNADTVIFVPALRFDLASHTLVADAYVLPLVPNRCDKPVEKMLVGIRGEIVYISPWGDEVADWKRLLPALAERCRTWKHGRNCEYLAMKSIPLSLEFGNNPLCSCGQGMDASAAFIREKKWAPAVPFVTRIAISPLFGVPYVEDVGTFMDTVRQGADKEFEGLVDECVIS